jgi:hypothetical protein
MFERFAIICTWLLYMCTTNSVCRIKCVYIYRLRASVKVSAHLVVVETKSCKNEYANWTNCCFVSKLTWCRVCMCVSCQVVFRSVQHLSSKPQQQQQRIRSDFTLESRVWLITIAGSAPNRCLIKCARPSSGEKIIHSTLPGRKRNENIYFHRCANPFAGVKLKESWNARRHTHTQPARHRHQRPRCTISEPTSCDTSLSSTAAESTHKARKLVTGTTKRAHSRIGEETLRETPPTQQQVKKDALGCRRETLHFG